MSDALEEAHEDLHFAHMSEPRDIESRICRHTRHITGRITETPHAVAMPMHITRGCGSPKRVPAVCCCVERGCDVRSYLPSLFCRF